MYLWIETISIPDIKEKNVEFVFMKMIFFELEKLRPMVISKVNFSVGETLLIVKVN